MEANIIQIRNPRSGRYIKINRNKAIIISHKKLKGPYKNIPIVTKDDK